MKKLLKICLALFASLALNSQAIAQEKISEGKIIYEISYPEMEFDSQMAAMMPAESVIYFKDVWSRTETAMGMGISSISIINARTNEITTLLDMLGNKTATVMKGETTKKDKNNKSGKSLSFELVEETKTIAGYPCKKAILKNADSTSFEMFYTDNILSKSQFTSQWSDFHGFPMEYIISSGGLNMKMTAKRITNESVPDAMFEIPSDYKLMTNEEFTKMMGGEERR